MKNHYLLLLLCTSVTIFGAQKDNKSQADQNNIKNVEFKEEAFWRNMKSFSNRPASSYAQYPAFPNNCDNWRPKRGW